MWTLIIIVSGLHGMSGAVPIAIDHVDGFRTKELCDKAAQIVTSNGNIESIAHCVEK